jgi:hypothetical protein
MELPGGGIDQDYASQRLQHTIIRYHHSMLRSGLDVRILLRNGFAVQQCLLVGVMGVPRMMSP